MSNDSGKLYELDPYAAHFQAKVVSIQGDLVVLDKTTFYPGGGGQDPDVGILNGFVVKEVRYKEGVIVHKVPGHNFQVGGMVEGEIDWNRRVDLMKAHTGEHMLFSALNRLVPDLELVKIAITPEKKSFMVRGNMNWETVLEAEREVNQAIWKSIPIDSVKVAKDDSLVERSRVKLERIPGDKVRLVRIGEFDLAACAGIHVMNTSEVGMLLVEKFTSARPTADYEIEFCVGQAAQERAIYLANLGVQAAELMGSQPSDLLSTLRNKNAELLILKDGLRKYAKQELANLRPDVISEVQVFKAVVYGLDRKTLSEEAMRLVQSKNTIAILIDRTEKATIVIAVSKDLPYDSNKLLQITLRDLGGKGGGGKDFASGAVPDPTLVDEIFERTLGQISKS